MNSDDVIRLRHMLDSARIAVAFAQGESRESLDTDLKLSMAMFRAIEIIGETAARISPDTRQTLPQIPWPVIIGMRNVLIHHYFDVDNDQVWKTVIEDIPPLIAALEQIVPPEAE